jgi:exonuclease SbcD
MLLLHTADWHLGRVTYNHSRRDDHRVVLEEIVAIAREQRPDLVIHAGDLFDAVRPAYEDMKLGLDALQELAAVAPTVVLCGNHDSPALFRIWQALLGDRARLRFVDRARPPAQGGILDFEVPATSGRSRKGGPDAYRLRLAPLPFVHQNRLVEAFEDPSRRTVNYADRVGEIERALHAGLADGFDGERDVLLFAAHLHVAGARFSGSERQLHVSDGYATRPEHLPTVSYAAFGHIHRPQDLPGTTRGRYAGSPLQLDFGELDEEKQVVLVELHPGDPARVTPLPLRAGRRLLHFEGTIAQLEERAPSVRDELCRIVVRTEQPVADLSERVRELLPRATLLQVREVVANRRLVLAEEATASVGGAEPALLDLFREYLAAQGTRSAAADQVLAGFAAFLRADETDEEPDLPAVALLREELPERQGDHLRRQSAGGSWGRDEAAQARARGVAFLSGSAGDRLQRHLAARHRRRHRCGQELVARGHLRRALRGLDLGEAYFGARRGRRQDARRRADVHGERQGLGGVAVDTGGRLSARHPQADRAHRRLALRRRP